MSFLEACFSKKSFKLLFLFIGLSYVLLAFYKLFFLGNFTWDTGAHAQAIANLAHNGVYYDNFNDSHPLSNHFRPILLLFVPFMKLAPIATWLLLAKIASFMAVSLVLLRFGRVLNLKGIYLYAMPMFWLVNDVLINTQRAENQGSGMSLVFIALAFYYAYQSRWRYMLLNLGALLLFKENLTIIWACVGLFLIVEKKDYKRGLSLIGAGVVLLIILLKFIMPAFSVEDIYFHTGKFTPFEFIDLKITMVLKVLLGLGFIPLLYPRSLIYSLPPVGMLFLTNITAAFWLRNHHHDFTYTVLFVACLFSIKKLQEGETWLNKYSPKLRRNLAVFSVLVFSLIALTKLPHTTLFEKNIDELKEIYSVRQALLSLKKELPKQERVMVSNRLGTVFLDHVNVQDLYAFSRFDFSSNFHYVFPKPLEVQGFLSKKRRVEMFDQLEAAKNNPDLPGEIRLELYQDKIYHISFKRYDT